MTARETELDAGRALEPSSDAAVSQVVDAASAAPQPGPALDASGPP
ncbi:MAG: hypothetical protein JWN48_3866, partial [Myxococcaceae bacterium]|nr:hypothetical protein [Myxococcaceae bacterium]